jgi:hypothetical protein
MSFIYRSKMRRLSQLSLFVLLAIVPARMRAQVQPGLGPARRVFPDVASGARTVRLGPDGHYYVLVAPGAAVLVFDSAGKKLGQVPAQAVGASAIVFGAALDIDAAGRIYVADRGGNAVNVYAADGTLLAHVRVAAPMGVAALPRDEFAVSSLNNDHLVSVYDFHGALLREFGDPVDPTDDAALNRRLNLGEIASDTEGNLYFAFEYMPEPTVRKYDRFGYLGDELSPKDQQFEAIAQLARHELAPAKTGKAVAPREVVSAIGVDPSSEEIWLALGDLLVHVDRSGKETYSQHIATQAGVSLAPSFIFAEPTRLLLGNDTLGIYEASRVPGTAVAH